jgi:serine/threonine protein kinase
MPDVVGGRYRVGRTIGRGGMGTVWLGRDETLQRDVAIKQVGLMPGQSAPDSARALREARSSAALSHRNVVTVFDVIEEDGSIWLVMEHVPSHSLAELIQERGPLPPAEVAKIGAQVADGLAAAHAAGTVHRDVKPGNVLLREDGVAKISDFGIARTVGDPTLTRSGLVTGTPSYFSPELARGAAPDPASDVWALGATLYAAVEGRAAYQPRENPVAVVHDIATSHPPRPKHAGPLEPVLERMLDRDPRSRWSMADAAHALHQVAAQHSPSTLEATRETTPAPSQENSWDTVPAAEPRRADSRSEASPPPAPSPAKKPSPAPSRSGSPGAPGPTTRPSSHRPSRSRGLWALALLAVLILVGGIGYLLLTAGDGSDGSASRRTSGSPKASHSSGASKNSSSPSSRRQSDPGTTSGAAGASTGASKAAFLRSYFVSAPGGTDTGWSRLGPGEQAQGRASYDAFWHGIRSVTVLKAHPLPHSNSVDATLVYRRTNGQTSTEHKRFDLVRSPSGGWLIDDEHPIG